MLFCVLGLLIHCGWGGGVIWVGWQQKVSVSMYSLAGGKKPRNSCLDLWVFLPEMEEKVRARALAKVSGHPTDITISWAAEV